MKTEARAEEEEEEHTAGGWFILYFSIFLVLGSGKYYLIQKILNSKKIRQFRGCSRRARRPDVAHEGGRRGLEFLLEFDF